MERLERFRQAMGLTEGRAALIEKPSNCYYLSGFTGEGMLLVLPDQAHILTDSRYTEQAERQAPGCAIRAIGGGVGFFDLVHESVKQAGLTTLFIEQDHVTMDAFAKMREKLPGLAFEKVNGVPEQLRRVKDEEEVAALRQACDISCRAFEYICGVIAPGITERDIRLQLENKMYELGAEQLAFDTIVASGPNGSLPHAVPGERKVQKGDLVTLDFGAKYRHYCADMTRTVAVGKPDSEMEAIYNIVLEAHLAAESAYAPGKRCADCDRIARDLIAKAGYGAHFGHGLGHGVGIDIHEAPSMSFRSDDTLEKGHVVTVEPGIYLPGKGGVRIENSCLITETGSESFVWAKRNLLIL